MPSRSWKTAMAVLAVFAPLVAWAADAPAVNRIKLHLQIVGLGLAGGDVEIRPAHAGCRFRPVLRTIRPEEVVTGRPLALPPLAIDAQSTNADRDCTFAITLREPGLPPKTFHRGLRLGPHAPGTSPPEQVLTCYLISPTRVAAEGGGEKIRK